MKRLLLALLAAVSAMPAQAAVLGQAGDADCFGLGGSCPAGTLWRDDLGGVFFGDYSDAGDPPLTDVWTGTLNPSFAINFAGGSGVSLFFKVAGIADDDRGPHDVYLNGSLLGQIPIFNGANGFQIVRDFTFDVPSGVLSVGSNTISFVFNNPDGDGYSFDYFQLNGDAGGIVPEPAIWAMMIGGFGAAGASLRRRRRNEAAAFA